MGIVRQSNLFLILRNERIKRLEYRNKLFDKRLTLLEYNLTGLCHRLLPHQKEFFFHRQFAFQQSVALRQCFIITDQCIQVFLIILGNHHIHKPSAFITSTGNQF